MYIGQIMNKTAVSFAVKWKQWENPYIESVEGHV